MTWAGRVILRGMAREVRRPCGTLGDGKCWRTPHEHGGGNRCHGSGGSHWRRALPAPFTRQSHYFGTATAGRSTSTTIVLFAAGGLVVYASKLTHCKTFFYAAGVFLFYAAGVFFFYAACGISFWAACGSTGQGTAGLLGDPSRPEGGSADSAAG